MKREAKPEWGSLPSSAIANLEAQLGSRVIVAEIAWGGYSPSASYKVKLADGRVVYVKGGNHNLNPHGYEALNLEIAAYRQTPQLEKVAPRILADVSCEGWVLLALSAVESPTPSLPWTEDKLRALMATLKTLYSLFTEKPSHLPLVEDEAQNATLYRGERGWGVLMSEGLLPALASHTPSPSAFEDWVMRHYPLLREMEQKASGLGGVRQVMHLDLRSDNILFEQDQRAVILDWPNICWGPLVFDLTYLVNGITSEGGPKQGELVTLIYKELGLNWSDQDWLISAANVAGYLAQAGARSEVDVMPRLRTLQRMHLMACLPWIAELAGLESPPPR